MEKNPKFDGHELEKEEVREIEDIEEYAEEIPAADIYQPRLKDDKDKCNMRGSRYYGKGFGSIRFMCFVDANPPAEIRWLKDEKPLTPGINPRVKLLENGQILENPSVEMEDAGEYTCIATNALGVAKTSSFLFLSGAPWVFIDGPSEEMEVGEEYEIKCKVVSEPRAKTINWCLRRLDSPDDDFTSVTAADEETVVDERTIESHLKYIAKEDVEIKCTAQNEHGSETESNTFLVSGQSEKPGILQNICTMS